MGISLCVCLCCNPPASQFQLLCSDPCVILLQRTELSSIINYGWSDYICGMLCVSLSGAFIPLFFLTSDKDVSEQTMFLPAASAPSPADVMPLILQLCGFDGKIQRPAVGLLLKGGLALEQFGVKVHAPAVQLLGLVLLVLQSLQVQEVPLQLIVGVVVSCAAQRHTLLLQGIFRGMNSQTEALRYGFNDRENNSRAVRQRLARHRDKN